MTLVFPYLLGSIPIIDPQSHPGKGLLRPLSCGLLIVAARRGRCCLGRTDCPCSGISVPLLGVLPCVLERAPCFRPLCPRRAPGEAVHLSSVIANPPSSYCFRGARDDFVIQHRGPPFIPRYRGHFQTGGRSDLRVTPSSLGTLLTRILNGAVLLA